MSNLPSIDNCTIAVIGLGYVGLPLAAEFAKKRLSNKSHLSISRRVIGYDINIERINELQEGFDRTNEVSPEELQDAVNLELTDDSRLLEDVDVYIITVPTPIDKANRPLLTPLRGASATVGRAIKGRAEKHPSSDPIIIYESTVFPGATEEVCVPILESESERIFNKDFYCGYSPERINPGDKHHKLTTIKKITSGSTKQAADFIDGLYKSIITAGTFKASSIKVAEAAKVIENTQRDLNIALVNELAVIFKLLKIDTLDVLEAAGTKWNFLGFKPGLVGGHCIGVDPYYLTHKSEELGYHPEIVLAGRRINDRMASWVVEQLILVMAQKRIPIGGAKVLVLGLTFKENCPDLRNTKSIDIIKKLETYGIECIVCDPMADKNEALRHYGIDLVDDPLEVTDNCTTIVTVAHDNFAKLSVENWKKIAKSAPIYDLKGIVPRELNPSRL